MTDTSELAETLQASIGLIVRRLRVQDDGDVSMSERSALSRLDRGGPTTSAALAKAERISPQSMGATLAALDARGLIRRTPDPADGRKSLLSLTAAGTRTVHDRRHRKAERLAEVLDAIPAADVRALAAALPVIERVAQSL